ncbi:hypothetical protein [Streptomyces sp. NPDC046712]|uniref:hypothetical protein n=1 Tax=Streptomyces sp. NPDC046712 TaxID=3154802 RepID=UPI00340A487F
MNALHQYLLDSYRAEQHRDRLPPIPGTHDIETLRAVRRHRRCRTTPSGRPRHRLCAALDRWLHPGAC